jgi:ABC-type dipeptide/oligopeptide/nickel transport system permease component
MYELVPGAMEGGNYPLVLGMVVVTTVLVVVIGGIVDLLHGLLDPRVRLRA